jgi:hypothetical protein
MAKAHVRKPDGRKSKAPADEAIVRDDGSALARQRDLLLGWLIMRICDDQCGSIVIRSLPNSARNASAWTSFKAIPDIIGHWIAVLSRTRGRASACFELHR